MRLIPTFLILLLAVAAAPALQAQMSSDDPYLIAGGDSDGDGVLNQDDRCPATPATLHPVTFGCAAVEVVADTETIGGPVHEALDRAAAGFSREDLSGLFGDEAVAARLLAGDLADAKRTLEEGLARMEAGDVCDGADTVAMGRDMMEQVSAEMGALTIALRTHLEDDLNEDSPDADALEVRFHELGYRAGLVGQGLIEYRQAHAAANAVCDQVVGSARSQGVIERTDEARGVLELRDGRIFALVDEGLEGTLYEGAAVRIGGAYFADSSGVALTVIPQGGGGSIPQPGLIADRCIVLRIAPFQPFSPPLFGDFNYTLHNPRAYLQDGLTHLESVARLAAVRTISCPSTIGDPDGKVSYLRYSLRLQYETLGGAWKTFVPDLNVSDDPVPLTDKLIPTGSAPLPGRMRVIQLVRACTGSGPRSRCSDTPEVVGIPEEMDLVVHPRASLGRLRYNQAEFPFEDWDDDAWGATAVNSMELGPLLFGMQGLRFDAYGYATDGSKTLVYVDQSRPSFAIHQDDIHDPDSLFALASTGVDKTSGLIWPRIKGMRNGHEFWYSAQVPVVIRDRIAECTGTDSYYRLPWEDGLEIHVGQGNNDPTISHTGSQAYAFDFSLAEGQLMRAARGGKVQWLQDSLTRNYNPDEPTTTTNQPFPRGDLENWGNAVRISHGDGTFSWYFHIQENGVLVEQGDVVQRGQPIAYTGNTGRSSGPHLHYQVQDNLADWGQSIPIKFETEDGDCIIPDKNDRPVSTNSNPNFP